MTDIMKNDIFTFAPPKQTLRAWGPFWDCTGVLFQFQNSDVADGDEELPEWRLYWVAGIALLRAVGHVLAKVDGKRSVAHSRAIAAFWSQLRADRGGNPIFWEFIEKERNNILKTYTFGAALSRGQDGYYVKTSDGQDAFQMFRAAVYWWRDHLMELEEKVTN